MDSEATAVVAKPSAPAAPPHTRISPLCVAPVVFLVMAFLPFWIVYGLVGALLTTPSAVISRRGLALLTLLAGGIMAEATYDHIHSREKTDKISEYPSLEFATLAVGLAALLYAQWWILGLLEAMIDNRRGSKTLNTLSTIMAPLCVLYAAAVSVIQWDDWWPASALLTVVFAVAYLAVPVVFALARARVWIPARFLELERLERELFALNVTSKFEQLVVAGLGTVFVPCTSTMLSASEKKTLVMIHGYGAGNALWACNLEYLAQFYDVYVVEWVGIGRSDRPRFDSYDFEAADEIFVDAIEKWRKELKLTKFYLVGHSMGAMFSSSYSVKYQGHVEHLVLLSPAGVGKPPSMDSLSLSARAFHFVWNLKLTPMSFIRFAGPLGPLFMRFSVSTRLAVSPETSAMRRGLLPQPQLADYWYHNWALAPSGEVAIHTHVYPGVHAKKPICEILTPKTIHVPITFLYGGGPDWMDNRQGYEVAKQFEGHQRVQVLLVPHAGHQVNTDNVVGFNTILHQVLAGEI